MHFVFNQDGGLDREDIGNYNVTVLAANLCSFEGEVPGDLPPLDNFDNRAKLNVIVTVNDEDDTDPVCSTLMKLARISLLYPFFVQRYLLMPHSLLAWSSQNLTGQETSMSQTKMSLRNVLSKLLRVA